jgi:hypothetical protein
MPDCTRLRMEVLVRSIRGLDIQLGFGCGLFIVVVLMSVLDTELLCVHRHQLVVTVRLILASVHVLDLHRIAILMSSHELRMENIEL